VDEPRYTLEEDAGICRLRDRAERYLGMECADPRGPVVAVFETGERWQVYNARSLCARLNATAPSPPPADPLFVRLSGNYFPIDKIVHAYREDGELHLVAGASIENYPADSPEAIALLAWLDSRSLDLMPATDTPERPEKVTIDEVQTVGEPAESMPPLPGRLVWVPGYERTTPYVDKTGVYAGVVLGLLRDGWTWKDISRAHKDVTESDIQACLDWAAKERPDLLPNPKAKSVPQPEPDADDDEPDAPRWQDRLIFDPAVSETSPVVKGTWVTAAHIISLVVDGFSWAEILRTHPELVEDDIRACLKYTIEEDSKPEPTPPQSEPVGVEGEPRFTAKMANVWDGKEIVAKTFSLQSAERLCVLLNAADRPAMTTCEAEFIKRLERVLAFFAASKSPAEWAVRDLRAVIAAYAADRPATPPVDPVKEGLAEACRSLLCWWRTGKAKMWWEEPNYMADAFAAYDAEKAKGGA
jgi:uncharacterized protein (DUF433 family)